MTPTSELDITSDNVGTMYHVRVSYEQQIYRLTRRHRPCGLVVRQKEPSCEWVIWYDRDMGTYNCKYVNTFIENYWT